MTKALIVYFSRSGNTKKLAKAIEAKCGADVEEITETASRSGISGYFRSGLDVLLSRKARIQPLKHELSDYDLIIIGTPVWMSSISMPVRALLENLDRKFNRVAAFCTQGGRGGEKALEQIEALAAAPLEAKLVVTQSELASDAFNERVTDFVLSLKP